MNKPIPFGKYYLLERINVGGMAEVFRAKQFGVEGFERLVAVKRILPNIAEDKEFIEMFVDEAKISVQLNHANIAQVFDLGHEEGSYYIALEHIHGRDLRAIFDRNRNQGTPMPVPQACFVIMKVCEGLDYAHNKRDAGGRELALVHRDVSPQNVIVSHEGEVKLIDFGIAKAAGRGSQTQAGILKGKFGYMSPEQVRGLPADRRSDVFSCGIVLYELLTGERLFVGESDFSTLEKVRNVEILPPSTYNRKIQPELERIVLKALAKDVEDRYQNAIDLHDELQAFVYTSGEFYSRKDLAGWMKQLWSKEIKEESAKLDSYRDMAPPVQAEASSGPPPLIKKNSRKQTASMGAQKPPPIPGKGGAGAKVRPGKMTTPMRPEGGAPAQAQGLEWDDDELETSIYDEETPLEEAEVVAPGFVPGNAPPSAPPAMAAAGAGKSGPTAPPLTGSALAADTAATVEEPDLSSLVATSQGWDAPNPTPEMLAKSSEMAASPERVADGSNRTKAPAEPELSGGVSEVLRMASIAAPSTTASGIPQTNKRSNTLYALIAISLLIAGGIVAVVLMSTNDKASKQVAGATPEELASKPVERPEVPAVATELQPATNPLPTVTGIANAKTGLDLIVNPPGVKVSLDGRPIGKAPLQIRSLRPGEHFIEIEAPAGFFSKSETVTVRQDKADRVEIKLVAMDIAGTFDSEPSGAEVILIADGVSTSLGNGPATATLDPRKNYEVVFKKDGFTTVTRPVEITGDTALAITGTLTKARSTRPATVAGTELKPKPRPVAIVDKPRPETPKPAIENPVAPKTEPKPKPPVVDTNATGTLLLASKPPCSIFIDGRDTGKKTPQRGLKLPVGKHRVTPLNNELGIKESFNVKISADKPTKAVKDYTGQID